MATKSEDDERTSSKSQKNVESSSNVGSALRMYRKNSNDGRDSEIPPGGKTPTEMEYQIAKQQDGGMSMKKTKKISRGNTESQEKTLHEEKTSKLEDEDQKQQGEGSLAKKRKKAKRSHGSVESEEKYAVNDESSDVPKELGHELPIKKRKKIKKSSSGDSERNCDVNDSSLETKEKIQKIVHHESSDVLKELGHESFGKKRKKMKRLSSSGDSEKNCDVNDSSSETKEKIPKIVSHESSDVPKELGHESFGKKRKKIKRPYSSGDSEKNCDVNDSSLETKEKIQEIVCDETSDVTKELGHESFGKRRKKIKRSSSSGDSEKNVLGASAHPAKEELETNSNDGAEQKKGKSETPVESEDTDEKKSRTPMFTDPRLPFGWRRECIQRKTGKTEGQYDVYLFNPAGKKFRSRVELARFLASTDPSLDPEDFDFSVYGHVGYHSNSATKKKIKSILEKSYANVTAEKEEGVQTESDSLEAKRLAESLKIKRTSIKRGRKLKEKRESVLPKKKARYKYTPTVNEMIKLTSSDTFCLSCGRTDCNYPRVELHDIAACGMLTARKGQIVFINNLKKP